MEIRIGTLLLNLIKVGLAVVVMRFLYDFFLIIADPIYSWCESAGVGRGIGGIGWILDPAIHVTAIFIAAILFGALLPRDRWIARPAATVSALGTLFWAALGVMHCLAVDSGSQVSFYIESLIIPSLCVAAIVFLFSPFFHDCGHKLRRYWGISEG